MLKLNPDPTFTADVEIPVPGDPCQVTVRLTFKYRGKDALKKLIELDDGGKDKERNDVEFLKEILAGWEGIDAEFNAKNLAIFADNYPAAARKIATEYPKIILVGRTKN